MYKKLMLAMAFAFAVVGVSPVVSVQAEEHGNSEDKITICHRTNSVKNPYRQITVDQNAADGETGNQGNKADHFDEHKGPVATSEAVAQELKDNKQKWGDIIPPIDGVHEGLNWTAEGQAIYNNDCQYVEQPEGPGGPVERNGGRGGDGARAPGAPAEAPQTQSQAPAAGVDAGGGSLGTIAAPAGALAASIAALGYGLLRLRNFGA